MRKFPEITFDEEVLIRKIEHLTDEEIIEIEAEVAQLPYSYESSINVLRKRDPTDICIDPD